MTNQDTIAAVVTPSGKGGVGIVRISGPNALAIGKRMTKTSPVPRYVHFTAFYNLADEIIDQGLLLFFQRPNSFTGENVIELHGHGGDIVLNLLLNTTIELGARPANPGEFSERAFINNKLDLTQAEAIADIIDAHSEQAAKSALKSLQGNFASRINELVDQLIALRMYIEATMDFPEEEIDFLDDHYIQTQYQKIYDQIQQCLDTSKQGSLLTEGMTIVIAGAPNAGKSSLLNALAERSAAIVTEIAGTTRDILKEHIQISGVPLHIIDTAGLRESPDIIEKEGIKRAQEAIGQADYLLYVTDVTQPYRHQTLSPIENAYLQGLPENTPVAYIYNKTDLLEDTTLALIQHNAHADSQQPNRFYISAKHHTGIENLKSRILHTIGFEHGNANIHTARTRHLTSLKNAKAHLDRANTHLQSKTGELLAEELKLTQEALAEITGEFSSDDLLGEIFSNFCIGK
jgi:tRNA modification GTPase